MTLKEIKNYLRIDEDCTEEDEYLQNLNEEIEIYIDSCAGEDYKKDAKLIKLSNLLKKKLIADTYENRSAFIEDKYRRDMIVSTILDKLSNYYTVGE